MRPPEYYLTTSPSIILWRERSRTKAYVNVGTVYGSSDDDEAQRFMPKLTEVTVDGRRFGLDVGLPSFNDMRHDAPEGSHSDVSGWGARGIWTGVASPRDAERVTAKVCWPEDQGCATVEFRRCDPSFYSHRGTVRGVYNLEGVRVPVGARFFYTSARDELGRQCGHVSVRTG